MVADKNYFTTKRVLPYTHRLSPEYDTVKRFRELGGKYVSVGSDAHYAQHIAVGIKDAMSAAKAAGFDNVTLFQKRQPIEIPIE